MKFGIRSLYTGTRDPLQRSINTSKRLHPVMFFVRDLRLLAMPRVNK